MTEASTPVMREAQRRAEGALAYHEAAVKAGRRVRPKSRKSRVPRYASNPVTRALRRPAQRTSRRGGSLGDVLRDAYSHAHFPQRGGGWEEIIQEAVPIFTELYGKLGKLA